METGIGETLRVSREEQGRSLEDAASAVRARVGQLQALEDERFDSFGGEVYAKGFLKSYALELGLDPAPLLEEFNRQVGTESENATSSMVKPVKTPGPKGTTPPAWAAWVLVAAVVVAGIYFLGLITPGDTPGQATEEVTTPPTPSVPEEDDEPDEPGDEPEVPDEDETETATEEDTDPSEEDASEEPDEPEIEGVEVILAFEGESWTRVMVDGVVILEETVPAGETLRYDGDEVRVRVGYASRVLVQYNGDDMGSPGGPGEVVELLFTEDGVEEA